MGAASGATAGALAGGATGAMSHLSFTPKRSTYHGFVEGI